MPVTRASGCEAEAGDRGLRRQQQRAGPVVDARRVAGGDGGAGPEEGLEAGEIVRASSRAAGCSSRSTTRVSRPAFTGTGTISSASQPVRPGPLGPLLASERVRVLVRARDAVLAGEVLRRLGHGVDAVLRLHHRVDEAPAERRVLELLVAAEGPRRPCRGRAASGTCSRRRRPGRDRPRRSRMARAAWPTASSPDAQSRLTVTPGTEAGSPASSAAIRATLRLSSPAWFAQPRITSSRAAQSTRGRRSHQAPRSAGAARSSVRTGASAPPWRPKGVRTRGAEQDARRHGRANGRPPGAWGVKR